MNRSFFVSVSSPSFVSAAVATPAFHPRQRATLGATDSPRARCLHNARLSGTHTAWLLSSPRERAHIFPPRTKKHPLFFPFVPWFSVRTPSLVFSTASRACTRTRAHYAHLSQFQEKTFTSSPTSRISLLHSGLRVKTLLFFPSPLSSRGFTPKVKNIRRGFSPKTGTNREETRGSKTVKAKVKEKSKSLHP